MRSMHLALALTSCLSIVAGCLLDRTGGLVREDAGGGSNLGGAPAGGGGSDEPASVGGGGTGGAGGEPGTGGMGPSVGDCVVDPPEVCDDCDTEAGDGCDGQGQVEPGWICPAPGEDCLHVSGVVVASGGATPQTGDQTATPTFEDGCPAGLVLVGLDATNSGDWPGGNEFLSYVVPRCAAPIVDAQGRYRWSESTAGATHGGINDCCVDNTTAYPSLLCPDDAFVVGYRAWVSAYVTQVEIVCGGMSFDGSSAVMDATTTTVGPMGSGAGTADSTQLCPTGSLAISLTGSAGAVLDLVGLGCGIPNHTLCGDGTQEGAEACDDGNAMNGDGCSALCLLES